MNQSCCIQYVIMKFIGRINVLDSRITFPRWCLPLKDNFYYKYTNNQPNGHCIWVKTEQCLFCQLWKSWTSLIIIVIIIGRSTVIRRIFAKLFKICPYTFIAHRIISSKCSILIFSLVVCFVQTVAVMSANEILYWNLLLHLVFQF